MSTQPLEDVANAGREGPLQLFQLYVIKDRKFCRSLIERELHPAAVMFAAPNLIAWWSASIYQSKLCLHL